MFYRILVFVAINAASVWTLLPAKHISPQTRAELVAEQRALIRSGVPNIPVPEEDRYKDAIRDLGSYIESFSQTADVLYSPVHFGSTLHGTVTRDSVFFNFMPDMRYKLSKVLKGIAPNMHQLSQPTWMALKGFERKAGVEISYADSIYLQSQGQPINFSLQLNARAIEIHSFRLQGVSLVANYRPGRLTFSSCDLTDFSCRISTEEVFIYDCTVFGKAHIDGAKKYVIEQLQGDGTLELSSQDEAITLELRSPINTSQLVFDDQNVMIELASNLPLATKEKMYGQLVRRFDSNQEARKKYEIAYEKVLLERQGLSIISFVKEQWNNFGYNKLLIFRNSLILIFFFFSINLFLYPKHLLATYNIETFSDADFTIAQRQRGIFYEIRNSLYCLIYTMFLFWGLKLSLEKLRIAKLNISAWILFQYLVGLICLGYIANVVITK